MWVHHILCLKFRFRLLAIMAVRPWLFLRQPPCSSPRPGRARGGSNMQLGTRRAHFGGLPSLASGIPQLLWQCQTPCSVVSPLLVHGYGLADVLFYKLRLRFPCYSFRPPLQQGPAQVGQFEESWKHWVYAAPSSDYQPLRPIRCYPGSAVHPESRSGEAKVKRRLIADISCSKWRVNWEAGRASHFQRPAIPLGIPDTARALA